MRKRQGGTLMFSRREINMLHDPYFRIIREEEQFVEIQSINTGHYWNVYKHELERKYKVTLYHKHKATDEYYHEHRKCGNVQKAIEEIKSHDEYVLEQEALKKQKENASSEQEMRYLKVYETSGYKYKPTPTIILKGEWLRSWGFGAGAELNVVCEGDGKLTITIAK